MFSDLRFAVRSLGKSPGFSTIAVLTLALGIAACATMFSVIHSAILRPLPYPEPDRLVEIWSQRNDGHLIPSITGPLFQELRDQATSFAHLSFASVVERNLLEHDRSELVRGLEVSANYLDLLGVSPQLGYGFDPLADQVGGDGAVVLLTDAFWRTRFGADPGIIGRTVILNHEPHRVIGVLRPGAIVRDDISFLEQLVLEAEPWRLDPANPWAQTVVRLGPGVTLADAEAQAESLSTALHARLLPERPKARVIRLRPMQEVLLANTQESIWMLGGAVVLLLAIVCANVASLLLVRATARQREMAVRSALGASAGRVVRLVLVESLVLAVLAGSVGVLLAMFGVDLAGRALVSRLPGQMQPDLDLTALAFTLALACGTGLAFGVFPALQARRLDLTRDLKDAGRGTSRGGRTRLQSGLVIAEVTLTALLLVSAGLLLRSFDRLTRADLGFDPHNVLVAHVALSRPGQAADEAIEIHRGIIRELSALPGVAAVGTCSTLPLSDIPWGAGVGLPEQPVTEHFGSQRDFVGGRYFEALGIPLVKGRYLTDDDNRLDAPAVAVISEKLAEDLLPGADPIGRRLISGGVVCEIVGVVRVIRHQRIEGNIGHHVYLPHVLNPYHIRLVVRTRVPPMSLEKEVRRVVTAVDPGQSVSNMRSLEEVVQTALQGRRVALALIGLFAVSALGLACLGIYGVMAYTISQRERELGIRIALGGTRRDVLALVVRDGMRLVMLGVVAGVLVALAAAKFIASLLYGVSAHDPAVLIGAPLVLTLVALIACLLPARRATRVDPIVALRAE